jgi:hypothetical protein
MKGKQRSMEGRDRYDAIAQSLVAANGAEAAKMFGMPTLKKNGKVFAGYYSGSMTFKLTGPAHAKALALPGARVFDPSGMGRAMAQWVEVSATSADHWEDLAKEALNSLAARA